MRKNALSFVLFLVVLIFINGCTTVKKPQESTPPQEKILVPQVTAIAFDTIDIQDAPQVVQDVAKDIIGKNTAAWLKVNNTAYTLISRSNDSSSYLLEVAEVLQKIPVEGYIWMQVIVNYKSSTNQEQDFNHEPLVVKFDLPVDQKISGVGFIYEKIRNQPNIQPETQPRLSPHENMQDVDQESSVDPLLKIDSPKLNEEFNGDIKVKCTIKNKIKNSEQLLVRLRDNAGQIIVEKPIVNAQNSFETTVSYPAPQQPEKGNIEALIFDEESGVEKSIVKIPVILK